MRMSFFVVATLMTVLLISPAEGARDGEWVTCPGIGVPSRIEPLLVSGKLQCTYWHWTESELLTTRVVGAKSGKPFTSCLKSNAGYKEMYASDEEQRLAPYTGEAFCSTTLTQDALNKTAYKWARWEGADRVLRRAKIGYMRQRQGDLLKFGPPVDLFPCRVKGNSSYVFGYAAPGGPCEYFTAGKVSKSNDSEFLLLVADYGWPTRSSKNGRSTIWLNTADQGKPETPKVCTTYIFPDHFDPWGVMGHLPGISNGSLCFSHAREKSHYDKKNPKGTIAAME
jgi:hypothetical protein